MSWCEGWRKKGKINSWVPLLSSRHWDRLFHIVYLIQSPSHPDNPTHFTDEEIGDVENFAQRNSASKWPLVNQTELLPTSLVCADTGPPCFTPAWRQKDSRAPGKSLSKLYIYLFHCPSSHSSCPSCVNGISALSTAHKWRFYISIRKQYFVIESSQIPLIQLNCTASRNLKDPLDDSRG